MKEILNIALVAHDSRKNELLDWVRFNADLLSKHHLYATGTTGRLISELAFGAEEEPEYPFKDKVTRLLSGPLGGDQQIGAIHASQLSKALNAVQSKSNAIAFLVLVAELFVNILVSVPRDKSSRVFHAGG